MGGMDRRTIGRRSCDPRSGGPLLDDGEHGARAKGAVAVIGRCSAAGCSRRAVVHLDALTPGGHRLQGPVCARCDEATRLAVFLVDLLVPA